MGQLITESLRKEKQALSDNKKIQKSEKKKLNIETFWRNTINTRRQVPWQHHKAKGRTCFPACCQWILNECPEIIYKVLSRMKMRRNLK